MARVPEFVKEQIKKKIGELRQEARDLGAYIQGSPAAKKAAAGGKGKHVMSDEAKKKISEARKAAELKKKQAKAGTATVPLLSEKAKNPGPVPVQEKQPETVGSST